MGEGGGPDPGLSAILLASPSLLCGAGPEGAAMFIGVGLVSLVVLDAVPSAAGWE